jgi:hypothetical protein
MSLLAAATHLQFANRALVLIFPHCESDIGRKSHLHNNVLRLLHVFDSHLLNASHFVLIHVAIVGEEAGKVENAELRAIRARQDNFDHVGDKVLLAGAFALPNTNLILRDLDFA